MTGKHLSFRPGNGRCWAVFRPMDRNGKRTQLWTFRAIVPVLAFSRLFIPSTERRIAR